MAILLSVNFTSCSEDDEPSAEDLVGEWILIHEKYSWSDSEGSDSEEYSYDFNNPEDGSERLIIEEIENNTYELTHYYYSEYNEEWEYDSKETVKLDGKKVNYVGTLDEEVENTTIEISSISSNKLVIKGTYKDEDGTEKMELTYQKKI